MDLNQKNIVYIGGCGGIGSATCRHFMQKNISNLFILDLTENADFIKELEALSSSTFVHFLKIDLRCKENIKETLNAVVSKIDRIDVLVNGSGLSNELDADLTIGVNLLGVIHATLTALPLMDKSKGQQGGTIVNIASVLGLDPNGPLAIYCASKAGVVLFTRSMATTADDNQSGVTFITICPGITRTGLLDQFASKERSNHPEFLQEALKVIKNQSPEDLARNIIEAIELNKNGAVYLCDLGNIVEVTFPTFWDVPRE